MGCVRVVTDPVHEDTFLGVAEKLLRFVGMTGGSRQSKIMPVKCVIRDMEASALKNIMTCLLVVDLGLMHGLFPEDSALHPKTVFNIFRAEAPMRTRHNMPGMAEQLMRGVMKKSCRHVCARL